jgi:RND superfamily putative drug exporter
MSGFVMALALLPFSYKVERRLETAVHIKGAESGKVDLELAQRFQSPYAHPLVLVISGIPDPDSAEGADALAFLTSSLRGVPGVSGAVSSLDWPDPLFIGNNGGALIIVGFDPHDETAEALVPKLRARADWMEGQLRPQYPNIKLEITGEAPLTFDLRKVSADEVDHAEERAMPVTLLLLLLAFGSLVARYCRWELECSQSRWRWVRLRYWRIICTCRFWCRIWRRCSALAWASTMHC